MRLHAHVAADGRLEALVAAPDDAPGAGLVPEPGLQFCEITGHGLKGDAIGFEQLEAMLGTHAVRVTPARGELVRRGQAD